MDAKLIRRLLYMCKRIRRVEERIAEVYPQQEMRCPVHLSIGQEAIAAGVCAALEKTDYVMSNHRSHGHYLAKGGDLKAMISEIYGKSTGCSKGKGGSMHLTDPDCGFVGATSIVASTIPIAVGLAFGATMKGENRISVAFFGDAATEEGVFYESLNFAALKNLPVIFVCENNLYSVYSSLTVRRPPNNDFCKLAEANGVRSFRGNGNDVLEVFGLTSEMVQMARNGNGPSFVEFTTYRWLEHCGPYYDNDLGYRTETEFEEWQKRCPISILESYMINEGLLDKEEISKMNECLDREINEAMKYAQESSYPDASSAHENIFAE